MQTKFKERKKGDISRDLKRSASEDTRSHAQDDITVKGVEEWFALGQSAHASTTNSSQ